MYENLTNAAYWVMNGALYVADIVARTEKTTCPLYSSYDSRLHTRAGVGGSYTNQQYVNCAGFRLDRSSSYNYSGTIQTVNFRSDAIWCLKNSTPVNYSVGTSDSPFLYNANNVAEGLPTWVPSIGTAQTFLQNYSNIGTTTISGTSYDVYLVRSYMNIPMTNYGTTYKYAWISKPCTKFLPISTSETYMYQFCMDECISISKFN